MEENWNRRKIDGWVRQDESKKLQPTWSIKIQLETSIKVLNIEPFEIFIAHYTLEH